MSSYVASLRAYSIVHLGVVGYMSAHETDHLERQWDSGRLQEGPNGVY